MLLAVVVVAPASTVPSVPSMHEDVHTHASQEQQERQRGKEVRTVLAEQKVRGNGAEDDQADRIARAPETFRFGVVPGMVVIHFSLLK